MVTTIKITCDGVFIHTNLQDTVSNERHIAQTAAIERSVHFGKAEPNQAANKTSISVADSNDRNKVLGDDDQTSSLPVIATATGSPLFSPMLVASSIKYLLYPKASTNSIDSEQSRNESIPSTHKLSRIDRSPVNGKYSVRTVSASGYGKGGSDRAIRRRNTVKSYLIECKEQLVRRLSSPATHTG